MTKNVRIFLGSVAGSFVLFWGINSAWGEFFFKEQPVNSHLLTAQVTPQEVSGRIFSDMPSLRENVWNLQTDAKAILSVFIDRKGQEKILFERNNNAQLPIASLTKLMTALMVVKNYQLDQEVAFSFSGESKEKVAIQDLLHPLLIESSNEAANTLARLIGEKKFVEMMNEEAKNLGLHHTYFVNPSGIDPAQAQSLVNFSTAEDLEKLAKILHTSYPQLFHILSLQEFDWTSSSGKFQKKLINTNKLLSYEGWPGKIIGGKTGETEKAKGCLLLVLETPNKKGIVVNVVLGSEDRFGEMKKLVDWVFQSYDF